MSIDEGYIKYKSDWTVRPPIDADIAAELNTWRQPLHEAGLIGHYVDLGIGFGNLSVRAANRGQFYISGTQTGHLARTDGRHYALVSAYDIDANTVRCEGPVQASSESLTHAAIYELEDSIGAIVHVHDMHLWKLLMTRLPATNAAIPYGTPEMAREFRRLFDETEFSKLGLAVMAGHDEGLVSIGDTLEQASLRMLDLHREFS